MPKQPHTPSHESGFSLVEVLISMLIFLFAAAGVSYVLISSNQQNVVAEHILAGQQYGMSQSVSNQGASATSIQFSGGQSQQVTSPISITLSPAQPTQACSPGLLNGIGQILGNLLSSISCFFGGCTPASNSAPSPTSYTVSVPLVARTISASQIAWWNP